MKLNLHIIVGIIALSTLCLSCEKSSLPEAESSLQTFYASMTEDDAQRVSLNGASVLWSNDDAISLYDGNDTSSGAIFTTTLDSDSKTAVFKGSGAQTLDGLYYAFYPAASDCFTTWNKAGDGKLRYKIPAIQYARAGNLPENCCPMLGSGDGSNLRFKHLVGYLSFKIGDGSPDNIVKVVVSSDASVLSGDYIWALGTSTKPSLGDGAATTSLQNRDSSPLGVGRYFVAVRPRVMKTLNLTFVTNDGKIASVSTNNVDVSLGKVQHLGTVRNLNFKKTVSVGDIYVENGEKTGIVVAVGSTDYTVMTLTGVSKAWASEDIASVSPLSSNRDNGSVNTATMAKWNNFNEDNFPAAYYCHNYGTGGWYLPGSSEMKTLMANMGFGSADTYAAFDKKITDVRGTTLGANNTIARFWCSDTDNNGKNAYYVYYKEPNGISAYTGAFKNARNTRCLKRISLE